MWEWGTRSLQYSCHGKTWSSWMRPKDEIQSRPKGWVKNIFWNLLPNFGHNEICQKYHPFCMAQSKVSKIQILNEIFMLV